MGRHGFGIPKNHPINKHVHGAQARHKKELVKLIMKHLGPKAGSGRRKGHSRAKKVVRGGAYDC